MNGTRIALTPTEYAIVELLVRRSPAVVSRETIANHAKHSVRAQELMAPLDDTLRERAFLLGRIGYADFALYGQLNCLALGGVVKIPAEMTSLRAYYNRVDRITAALDPNA